MFVEGQIWSTNPEYIPVDATLMQQFISVTILACESHECQSMKAALAGLTVLVKNLTLHSIFE